VQLSGGEIIMRGLRTHGIQYVSGVPGVGAQVLLEFLLRPGVGIPFIRVVHEQSAVFMADGYFRACGRPMAVLLPSRVAVAKSSSAIANCFLDSSGALLLSGEEGRCQLERCTAACEPAVDSGLSIGTNSWSAPAASELPLLLDQAFARIEASRPSPAHIEVSLRVQMEVTDVRSESPGSRPPRERLRGSASLIAQVANVLCKAECPLIIAGRGVITSEATAELVALAEALGAPIVTTRSGSGAVPNEHYLNGYSVGSDARSCGDELLACSDVVLLVGSRLSELSPDSHLPRTAIGHARLIQVDVDGGEIGKVHAIEIGLLADAKTALADIKNAVPQEEIERLSVRRGTWLSEFQRVRAEWLDTVSRDDSDQSSLVMPRQAFIELRKVLDAGAVLVVGAGAVWKLARQALPALGPHTLLSAANPVEAGWAVPASIGAKLAMPARQVVCVVEDADFLQSMQEMAVCIMHSIPVVFIVCNRSGPDFVHDIPGVSPGPATAAEFSLPDGKPYSPIFAETARSFGLGAWRVEHASQLAGVFKRALDTNGPSLVEIMVVREEPDRKLSLGQPNGFIRRDRERAHDTVNT
jgi:acetolactate synthase I/II/III large subunit